MSKNQTYEQRVEALIKGDNAKEIAVKNKKQIETALKTQLAIKEGYRLDKEEAVATAQEKVQNVMLNGGKVITTKPERDAVLTKYFQAKTELQEAEAALVQHELEVKWLEEADELLK